MASITTWYRVEPRSRSSDLSNGIAARVHDPLWMLCRQWQVGEFAGHDGGTPIASAIAVATTALDQYSVGGGSDVPFDGSVPIEAIVEREVVRPQSAATDVRQAAEAGLQFARMLSNAKIDSSIAALYLTAYPIAQQSGDAAMLSSVVAGRTIDGVKLYADVGTVTALPAMPAVPPSDADAVFAVVQAWRAWYASLFSEPAANVTGWQADRFEYAFSLSSSIDGTHFVANEYDGGYADWYTFDRVAARAASTPVVSPAKIVTPTPISFRGMPARRFWEMEDAAVDIGALSAAAEDIGRLLLREFALVYGNDWFGFPIVVPIGTRTQIASLTVTDTFGTATAVPHYGVVDGPSGGWKMFAIASDASGPPVPIAFPALPHELVVTASALASVYGTAIEDVMLLRDELALMVWGIERTIAGASGSSIDLVTAWNTSLSVAPPPSGSATPQYRLGTSVPDYWIPFMPAAATSAGAVKLVRATMPTADHGARSRILLDVDSGLYLEEVPREGVLVERLYRIARGTNGAMTLWLSRRS
ncbi:MAG TPA: hypothetical protein VGF18_04335, partial [Candidatus Tumulicola sp.]